MSDKSSLIGSENLQTVVAVTFVLALLGIALNYFNYSRTSLVASGESAVTEAIIERVRASAVDPAELAALRTDIAALQNELKDLKAAQAAAAAPPTSE